ncbi:MAG: translation initiation factor IF-3 [Limnochordia bacterium]
MKRQCVLWGHPCRYTKNLWRWSAIQRGSREVRSPRNRGPRINDEIRGRRVRVIDPEGNQLGILTPDEALAEARARGLDLVEVSPNSQPPVCRVMDFGKFKYEQSKKDRETRKKQQVVELKELRLRPKIDDHDFEVKVRNARKFLEDGNKVKIAVRFRGREIVHRNLAEQKLAGLASDLASLGTVERTPIMEGRQLIMILAPTKTV